MPDYSAALSASRNNTSGLHSLITDSEKSLISVMFGAVERFSVGVRNPTGFLAGALVSHFPRLHSQ